MIKEPWLQQRLNSQPYLVKLGSSLRTSLRRAIIVGHKGVLCQAMRAKNESGKSHKFMLFMKSVEFLLWQERELERWDEAR